MARMKQTSSDLRSHLGFWMRLVSNHVSHAFARRLGSAGVTVAEWVVLREMFSNRGTTSPSAVAELTGLTRGAVSKLVERLLRKKLVSRRTAPGDRRWQDIELTAAARTLVPRLARLADANDREFFGVLTAAERRTLDGLLRKTAQRNRLTRVPIA